MDDYLIKTFEGLFEDAEEMILIVSAAQNVIFTSKKVANLFQQTPSTPFYLQLCEQSKSLWPHFIENLETNLKGTCVITVKISSNQYLTIRLHSYYIPEKQLVVSRVSIPSMVQHEKRPFLSEASIDKMIQNIADGVVLTSLKGQVITANSRALQYLGCELGQIENRSHDCLFAEMEQKEQNVLRYYRQLANYETATLNVSKVHENGQTYYYYIESRVDVTLNIITTTIIDETEKVTLLNKVEHRDSPFLIAQNFASIVHELRNPITSLAGFLQLLREEIEQDYRGFLHIMEMELKRMDLMLEDLLSFSKPRQIQFERFCLLEMVREVVDLMQMQAILGNVILEIEYKKMDDLIVYGYRTKLKQVVINLVKNALEATSACGRVTIKLGALEAGKQSLIVCDNGIGMTPQTIENLFNPYYTTKATGTGLGMMFVKKVIEEHKADMMFCTDVGYGTQVKIVFNPEGYLKEHSIGELMFFPKVI